MKNRNSPAIGLIYLVLLLGLISFGLWMGVKIGENGQKLKLVVDGDFLIYESVLYKKFEGEQ